MSKITISAVLTVLRLVISFLGRVVRLIYSIIDLVDDGCLNSSTPRPDWIQTLAFTINTIEDMIGHLSSVEDDLSLNN